jgi:CheY-like chemotaxis protein
MSRIVIVEDNPDGRESLRLLLQLFGHDVEVTADGLQGVRTILRSRPTVALVDIGLPELDGYQVAQRVRRELGQAVFLVAITGYGRPEDRRQALDAGFDVHLTKPVDPQHLTELLSNGAAVSLAHQVQQA